MDGKAVVAHDALDVPFVAKKMHRFCSVKKPPACDELLPLTSGIVLFDLPCPEAIVVPDAIDEEVPHLSVPDHHSHYNRADFTALGRPVVRVHQHPAGLTELHFDNCIVKVRAGIDLDDLIRCSANGVVALRNLSTNGWVTNSFTVLPSFVFLKYLSGFDSCQ